MYRILANLGLFLSLFGTAFPIYGPNSQYIKISAWRVGLPVMSICLLAPCCEKINRKFYIFFLLGALFVVYRLASFLLCGDPSASIQQVFWFLEDLSFLFLIYELGRRNLFSWSGYLKLLVCLSYLSVCVIFIQYIGLLNGMAIELPYSTSSFGIPAENRVWTYPIYGGRIIGAFYEPNMAGTIASFLLTYTLLRAISKPLNVASRIMHFISLIPVCMALVATGSRQGICATIVATAVGAYYTLSRIRNLLCLVILIGLGVVAVLNINKVIEYQKTPFGENIETAIDRMESSDGNVSATDVRLTRTKNIIDQLDSEVVIFGRGESLGILSSHNAFAITLNQVGIIGLAIFLGLIASLFNAISVSSFKEPMENRSVKIAIASAWLLFITVNWAQLGQTASYGYLGALFLTETRREIHKNRRIEYENCNSSASRHW